MTSHMPKNSYTKKTNKLVICYTDGFILQASS